MRAIIYARVSTDDQRSNYSIPSQIDECKNYIERKGYFLVGNRFVDPVTGLDAEDGIAAFVDDYSSREMNRPGLDAAYEYLEVYGYDVVVVYSIDRLDRDPYKLRTHEYGFLRAGAQVEYVKGNYEDTPDGNFMKTVVAAAAKLDNDWRTERFSRGKRQKARRGIFPAGRAPFGYIINKEAPGGLEVNKDQSEVVKLVFNAYVNEDTSVSSIVKMLNQKGVQPLFSEKWGKSSVHRMLSNTAYIGKVFYNKHKRVETSLVQRNDEEWIEISVTPIIDHELFQSAQSKLSVSKESKRKQPSRFYLLSGMVYCFDCGKAYVCQAKNAGQNRLINDALSYRHRVTQGHCRNHTISARILDPIVWESVKELLLDPVKLKEGFEAARRQEEKSFRGRFVDLENLSKDRVRLEKQLQNLNTAYTDPDIDMTKIEYLEQRKLIENDLKSNANRMRLLESAEISLPTVDEYETLEKFSKEIRTRLTGEGWVPTPENQKTILKLLKTKVMLNDKGEVSISSSIGGLSTIVY